MNPTLCKSQSTLPAVDIHETENAVILWIDVPGVEKENIQIQLEKQELKIQGKGLAFEEKSLLFAEFRAETFERSFTLSEELDGDQIQATLDAGVLRLEVPKKAQVKPRKIEIQTLS
jgi:HSP20 family protein